MKPLKRVAKVVVTILVIAIVAVLALIVYDKIMLRDFESYASAEYKLPGVEDPQFDQQALEYDTDTGLFFCSGYMRDKSASPLYLMNPDTGDIVKTLHLYRSNGDPVYNHVGGVSIQGDFVYFAGSTDCCLYVFSKQQIMAAADGSDVKSIGDFSTQLSEEDGVKVSYVSRDDTHIYVGEFHFPVVPLFKLRANHQLETSIGKTEAIIAGFPVDENAEFGLAAQPDIVYAIPDGRQSVCFYQGAILTTVASIPTPAKICANTAQLEGTYTLMGATVPLYSLQPSVETLVLPMAEEITVYNGQVYIMSELYNMFSPVFGGLFEGDMFWHIPLEKILGTT